MIPVPRHRSLLTYGVFDAMDPADTATLRKLSFLGAEVIVGCATDEFCARHGLRSLHPFAERRRMLERNRYVSRVIAQDCWDQIRTDIVNYNVSALALPAPLRPGFEDLEDIAQVLYLPVSAMPVPIRALAS